MAYKQGSLFGDNGVNTPAGKAKGEARQEEALKTEEAQKEEAREQSPRPPALPQAPASGEQDADAQIRTRMDALVRELERHNHLYHTLDAPEISDEEYDVLFAELTALEARYPAFKSPHSPTLRTGGALLPGLERRRHT